MDDPNYGQRRFSDDEHLSTKRMRAFGCFALVGLPLSIILACGGACASIGKPSGERELAFYSYVLLGLGVATLIASPMLAVWLFLRRDR